MATFDYEWVTLEPKPTLKQLSLVRLPIFLGVAAIISVGTYLIAGSQQLFDRAAITITVAAGATFVAIYLHFFLFWLSKKVAPEINKYHATPTEFTINSTTTPITDINRPASLEIFSKLELPYDKWDIPTNTHLELELPTKSGKLVLDFASQRELQQLIRSLKEHFTNQ